MSWAVITEANVLTHIAGAELKALRAAALGDGQEDPVQPSITQITDQVRGYVAACIENKLDTDITKIPTRLLGAACDMIIGEIIARVPGYFLDDDRKDKQGRAIKLMERVAACNFAIEDPNTGADGGGAIKATTTTRDATRAKLSGL